MDGFDSNRGHHPDGRDQPPRDARRRPWSGPAGSTARSSSTGPTSIGREQILKVHARTVPLDEDDQPPPDRRDDAGLRRRRPGQPRQRGRPAGRPRRARPTVGRHEFEEGVERVIAGPEKRQRVLRRDEKRRIAYPRGRPRPGRPQPARDRPGPQGLDPRPRQRGARLHDVPPRGRPLPPHPDARWRTRSAVCWAARVAEELVYGEVSDGCTSDLQRATQIARRMVAEFGMSPTLGRVSYQTEGRSPFLPGGGANDYIIR